MKRREFVKSTICLGCAGALGLKFPFANANEIVFTPEEELAMQKFVYKSVEELPKAIRLDICNLCQLNCPECFVRKNERNIIENGYGFGYTSFATFKKFIETNPFIQEIELSNHGEIFLNPDFDKIIKYACEKGLKLTALTGVNLNKMSEKTAENLVKYKFRRIIVSIDGATPETYAIYRRGGDFNTVINNIKLINKYKSKYNSPYPELTYKFILFGHNEHEIEDAKNLAKKLNMIIRFEANCSPWYSPLKNREGILKSTNISSIESNEDKNFQDYLSGQTPWYFCTDLFNSPQISWNGRLLGCCMTIVPDFGVNVFERSLLEALNDKKILYTKLILTDLKYQTKFDIPCNKCYIYSKIRERNCAIKTV